MAPPTVSVLPLTVTVGLAPRVTAPVPRFRALLPVNVKLPFQFWGLLLLRVMPPLWVQSITPPEIVKAPAAPPSAVALLTFSCPALRVVPPVYVLAPDKVSVPVVPVTVSDPRRRGRRERLPHSFEY